MKHYQILIAEDDDLYRKELKNRLEKEGYKVTAAKNGKDALVKWDQDLYDLLIVDIKMPEMKGSELIKIIREKHPYVQIIIFSGGGEYEDAILAVNCHVYAYLDKSKFSMEELIQTISEALEKWLENRNLVLVALDNLVQHKPDETMQIPGREEMTARELYDQVRKGTEFGKKYVKDFRQNITEYLETNVTMEELSDWMEEE